eukprot:TRINITY_DN5993_c0_g1_i1.p1 TRINITY_DN5993_c0_g1~~TRINITY_DN5993_c0_g1_i1.p1  ORF type:complete len:393 (-),score=13.07 TRINITY_DN5993_c0_g1_i1:985-2163(-)
MQGSGVALPAVTPRRPLPTVTGTIVFTDVKDSTAVREATPDAMSEALHLHDDLVFMCFERFHGYAVNQAGDSFVGWFESPGDALLACLNIQRELPSLPWPQDLSPRAWESESGRPTLADYHGLHVRMSMCFGTVIEKPNKASGRRDFEGTLCDTAARLLNLASPGSIVVDSATFRALSHDQAAALIMPQCDYSCIGSKMLKGISSLVQCYCICNIFSEKASVSSEMGTANAKCRRLSDLPALPIPFDEAPLEPVQSPGAISIRNGSLPSSPSTPTGSPHAPITPKSTPPRPVPNSTIMPAGLPGRASRPMASLAVSLNSSYCVDEPLPPVTPCVAVRARPIQVSFCPPGDPTIRPTHVRPLQKAYSHPRLGSSSGSLAKAGCLRPINSLPGV